MTLTLNEPLIQSQNWLNISETNNEYAKNLFNNKYGGDMAI